MEKQQRPRRVIDAGAAPAPAGQQAAETSSNTIMPWRQPEAGISWNPEGFSPGIFLEIFAIVDRS